MINYIKIARPDHWIKNVFILPGIVFACLLTSQRLSLEIIGHLLIGFAATCLIASANYVINEWLDADFDKHHPTKSLRPAVAGGMNVGIVIAEYLALAGETFPKKPKGTGIVALFPEGRRPLLHPRQTARMLFAEYARAHL